MTFRCVLASLAVACSFTAVAVADVGPGMLAPWPDDQQVQMRTSLLIFGDSHTDNPRPGGGGDAALDLRIYEAAGRVRLDPSFEGSPSLGLRFKYLDLNTDDPALPPRLVDQAVGYGMGIGQWGDWLVAFTAGVGYAGNNPFADSRALYGLGNLIFKTDLDERTELRLVLNYNGNRTIFPDIPLPSIAYTRYENESFTWTAGFPFSSITWKPLDRLTLRGRYFFPTEFEAEIDYEVFDGWSLFAQFEGNRDAFRIKGDESHRLFFRQRRVEGGLRWEAMPNATIILAGGYAFSQQFTKGWDIRSTDTIANLDSAPYFRAAFELQF